jgi:hypothetical protein
MEETGVPGESYQHVAVPSVIQFKLRNQANLIQKPKRPGSMPIANE